MSADAVLPSIDSARPVTKARRWAATLFGAFLCLMLSAAFFPNQLSTEAQTKTVLKGVKGGPNIDVKGSIVQFIAMWDGTGKAAFCGESAGLQIFKKINLEHWKKIPDLSGGDVNSRDGFFLTLRIISCMVGTQPGDGATTGQPGAIIYYGRAVIKAVSTLFTNIILAVSLLALVLLGVRVTLGQQNEFLPGLFVILLKIGLLLLAVSMLPVIYDTLVDTINKWSGHLAMTVPSYLCPAYNKTNGVSEDYIFLIPWAKLDCASQSIIEVGQNSVKSPIGTMVATFMSSFLGKGISASFVSMIYALGVVMEVAMTIMLLAHLAIIMMLMIAPLAWACIFFRKTQDYFTRWLGMIVGFTMQPILLALFMMMFVNIYESVVCSSRYSVVAALNNAADTLGLSKNPSGYTNPDTGTPLEDHSWGPKHCSVPMIQRAFLRISTAAALDTVIGSYSVADATPEQKAQATSIFSQIVEGATEMSEEMLEEFKNLSTFTFKWPGITTKSLGDKVIKALSGAFLAMFTAFIILFVLFNFLKQLPEFVNLLAAAAVESGDINKVNRIGGDIGKSGLSGLKGANSGFEQGLRGSGGDLGKAQQGMLNNLKNFAGKG